ncbi:MAG: phosphatidylserine decarboxylase [Synergistaceae bacterium]|uniref:phosphatidylserine decarboxylase n=1 Tax=Aminivibrio sp. TaxID=1872489 RepID=UPI001DBAD90B|nr:phosphatidylserine decarboxylase [Synergistaceae bacterium]MDD3689304.1 phosphatidylserine decarboxylase [Synergistaceae bacterium]MDD4021727.1 phosphatidylserine decarboxylase [Synergistaceae bacterium]MDD4612877.1 phosphatidylserine decarboxylase [Synergistaceae bacterium]NCC57321.1 phosphatidylserine decarboxylase family protein [Synergistales bacterium]
MKFRPEVKPFLLGSAAFGGVIFLLCAIWGLSMGTSLFAGLLAANISAGYMLFFFRDPDVFVPDEPGSVIAAASGKIAKITDVYEKDYLKTDTVRISIFLSLLDVHVNRFPISGYSTFLGYFPGRRLFTFQEKSSEVNQNNKILVRGEGTSCLVTQIVGPVCRRVVYWLRNDKTQPVKRGERFGMMKFGSRLDMYFPKGDIEITAQVGDQVHAGRTVIGRILPREEDQ